MHPLLFEPLGTQVFLLTTLCKLGEIAVVKWPFYEYQRNNRIFTSFLRLWVTVMWFLQKLLV